MHMHLQRPLKSQSLHNMLAEKLSSPWVHPRFKGGARKHQSQKNKNRAELITKDSSCRVKIVARAELRLLLSTLPKLLTSRYTPTPPFTGASRKLARLRGAEVKDQA